MKVLCLKIHILLVRYLSYEMTNQALMLQSLVNIRYGIEAFLKL